MLHPALGLSTEKRHRRHTKHNTKMAEEEEEEESPPSPFPNWSEIPTDILLHITKSLKHYPHYIHLRSVCSSFHSSLPLSPPHPLPPQLPLLLLSPPPSSTFHHRLLSLISAKTHSLPLPPSTLRRRICGSSSSSGHLILAGDTPLDFFSLNPFTLSKLSLPPLSSLPFVLSFSFSDVGREYSLRDPSSRLLYSLDLRQMRDLFVSKLILSRNHNPPFTAVAIVNSPLSGTTHLCYSSSSSSSDNDNTWKLIPVTDFPPEDVVYSESDGLSYAVNKLGHLLIFDLMNNNTKIIPTTGGVHSLVGIDLNYVVKFEDELFLVSRRLGAIVDMVVYSEVYETLGFDVYRFQDGGVWDQVTDLGDRVLFVGLNSSLGLLASDFPGCQGNRIYFTDDHSKLNDVGFFDLGNECVEPLPCYPQDVSLPFQWAPAVWISPNPC